VVANSGAVGMVGLILGGGYSAFTGLHGLVIDNVLSVQGITAAGRAISLDASSSTTGEERAVFDVLLGAGYGLMVVTSVTMRAFPLSSLQLDDHDKLFVHRWMFPVTAIQQVAELFRSLTSNISPKMSPVLVVARAPPSAPVPDVPVLLLTITYFGPGQEAEAIIGSLIAPDVSTLAISSQTIPVPVAKMLEGTKMFDIHGGFNAQHTVRAANFSPATIVDAFTRWKQFGDDVEDARPLSTLVFFSFDPTVSIANGSAQDPEARGRRMFAGRDRPPFCQAITWYSRSETKPAAEKYVAEVMRILRRDDTAKGLSPLTLPNNMRDGLNMEQGYTEDMLVEMKRVHKMWNENGLFYNVMDDVNPL
jgi:hypothetical protein